MDNFVELDDVGMLKLLENGYFAYGCAWSSFILRFKTDFFLKRPEPQFSSLWLYKPNHMFLPQSFRAFCICLICCASHQTQFQNLHAIQVAGEGNSLFECYNLPKCAHLEGACQRRRGFADTKEPLPCLESGTLQFRSCRNYQHQEQCFTG